MKKGIVLAAALLLTLSAWAQPLRTSYRSGDITHISTEYQTLPAPFPARLRLERAVFADGTALYVLYLKLEQETRLTPPRGVKLTAHFPGGQFVRLEQIGQDSPARPRLENGLYLNRFKYAVSEEDLQRLCKGVRSLEIVTGWGPEDVVTLSFPDDAFSALLYQQVSSFDGASCVVLDSALAGYADNPGNVMITSGARVAQGETFPYNVILSYLYYKNTDEEDIDLAFMLGSETAYTIPRDSLVRFTLRDGAVIELPQTREDVNFVYLYPTMEEVRLMATVGVASLSIATGEGVLEDRFPTFGGTAAGAAGSAGLGAAGASVDGTVSRAGGAAEDFSAAIWQQLQLLLSASPL